MSPFPVNGEKLYEEAVFHGMDLYGLSLSGSRFFSVRFIDCAARDADLSDSVFDRCVFTGCDLSGAHLASTRWLKTEILDSKLQGSDLSQSRWKESRIRRCVLAYACLAQSVWQKGCEITRSDLRESILEEMKPGTLRIESSDLSKASVKKTMLAGMDLSTNMLPGISASADFRELRGALVSVDNAIDLSLLLGIILKR